MASRASHPSKLCLCPLLPQERAASMTLHPTQSFPQKRPHGCAPFLALLSAYPMRAPLGRTPCPIHPCAPCPAFSLLAPCPSPTLGSYCTYLADKREEPRSDVVAVQAKGEDSSQCQCTAHGRHVVQVGLRVLDVPVWWDTRHHLGVPKASPLVLTPLNHQTPQISVLPSPFTHMHPRDHPTTPVLILSQPQVPPSQPLASYPRPQTYMSQPSQSYGHN